MPDRPVPGTITTREIRVEVCSHCGYAMSDTGLCADDCPLDGEPRTAKDFFIAVYKRADEFLRDEKPDA